MFFIALLLLVSPVAVLPAIAAPGDTLAKMRPDFITNTQTVSVDRLRVDGVVGLCNATSNNPKAGPVVDRLQQDQLDGVQFPKDGFIGDWKRGEKLAQSGKGMTWTDKPGEAGGNCYNCHQLSAKELSFGTMGPSLYRYGRLRGYNDEVIRYTYAKISNSKAFTLCSDMPRFGHSGALNQQQIKDLVALLLDPTSEVNQ